MLKRSGEQVIRENITSMFGDSIEDKTCDELVNEISVEEQKESNTSQLLEQYKPHQTMGHNDETSSKIPGLISDGLA